MNRAAQVAELPELLHRLRERPEEVAFNEVIALIDAHYDFTPVAFLNGALHNAAGQNSGSCKIFSFARLHQLSQPQTLLLFGDYYRKDVLGNPSGADHQNIRNFIKTGWDGIAFEGDSLQPRRA